MPLSLVALGITIYYSALQSAVEHLKIQKDNLQAEKDKLSNDNRELSERFQQDKARYEDQTTRSRADINRLRNEEKRLTISNKRLSSETREVRDKLQDEEFETNLQLVLEGSGGNPSSGGLPYPIRHLVEIAHHSGPRKQARLSKLAGALTSSVNSGIRIAVVIVLYEGTGATKWIDLLAREFAASYKETPSSTPLDFANIQFANFSGYAPALLAHLELANWDHPKKVRFCTALYSLTDWKSPYALKTIEFIRYEFFTGDHSVSDMELGDGRFVLGYLAGIRDIVLNKNQSAQIRIMAANLAEDVSKEAALVFFGALLSRR